MEELYDPSFEELSFGCRVSRESVHVSLRSRQRISRTNEQGEVIEELTNHRILGESDVYVHLLMDSSGGVLAHFLKEEIHRWMPAWSLSLCDRLSQYVVHNARRLFALTRGNLPANFDGLPRGLSCDEINKLETELFDDESVVVVCSVCIEEFFCGVEITKLPCSHTFHNRCIASWLKRTASCPLCRFDITQSLL